MGTIDIKCTGDYEIPPGYDGPISPGHGCGATITVEDDNWDVKTDETGKPISKHKDVRCPRCGVHTFVERTKVIPIVTPVTEEN